MPDLVRDGARLEALAEYGILDTPPEPGFDDIVQIAAQICDTPVALVSLVAEDRQWFKARIGFDACQTSLNRSVCAFVLGEPDLLVIPDLTRDQRTAGNPLVTEAPHIRFYAGAPLRTPQGQVVGSLCVIDTKRRPQGLSERQADSLRSLARQVMTLMEMRRSVSGRDIHIAQRQQIELRLGEDQARLQLSEAHWRGLFERLGEGVIIGEVVRDAADMVVDWRYVDVNAAWGKLVGIEPKTAVGRTVREVFPEIGDAWVQECAQVVETGEPATFTRQVGHFQRWYEGRVTAIDHSRFAIIFLEVTERIRAERRRAALIELNDRVRDIETVAELTATASAIVGQAVGAIRVSFGRLDSDCEHVEVEPDWTAANMVSIAGRHRFADYGSLLQDILDGDALVVRDVITDPRTAAEPTRLLELGIRALVNIPIQERGRTVGILLVHAITPRTWSPGTVGFLRTVADRVMLGVARLRAEEDQRLLNQEISHRLKNSLAMVQAIAAQTLKGTPGPEAVAAFQQRLLALSSAHDVLLQQDWSAAAIRTVIDASLRHFGEQRRFDISGPSLKLGLRSTMSLSLLLHELATNALKYGSLSVEAGRVAIAWRVEDEEQPMLVLTWQEQGGPPAAKPSHKGFGSRLISSGLVGSGNVELSYTHSGFNAEMRANLDQVQDS